ncbi:MAG: hypothetical protein L6R45_06490 [Anaerolineae bacterium]|nr:hypothetical protein [Anaerolineae bacterium]
MDEQQLADLFSEQIDRMLGGQPAADFPTYDHLPELLALGQQLSQVTFQPEPAALAAFQQQLTTWFGSAVNGGGITPLGLPKVLLVSIGLVMLGTGLGLFMLLSSAWTNSDVNNSQPAPLVVTLPAAAPPTAVPISAPTAKPQPETTSALGDTLPAAGSSVGDKLPTAPPSLGDTLPPLPTPTPTSTSTITDSATVGEGTLNEGNSDGNDDSANNDGTSDGSASTGDHDRGHGNDLDGIDEDNPGQSGGVAGGNSQNNGGGGGSPVNLSSGNGGGGGGQSGNGNNGGGGGGNGNGGNGGGNGNGKGDK